MIYLNPSLDPDIPWYISHVDAGDPFTFGKLSDEPSYWVTIPYYPSDVIMDDILEILISERRPDQWPVMDWDSIDIHP